MESFNIIVADYLEVCKVYGKKTLTREEYRADGSVPADLGPGRLLAGYGPDESQDDDCRGGHEICHHAGLRPPQGRSAATQPEGLQAQIHGADHGQARRQTGTCPPGTFCRQQPALVLRP